LTQALKKLAKHSVIAMVGGVVCSMVLGTTVVTVLQEIGLDGLLRRFNFDAWYLPIVWGPGFLLGFLVNRRTLHRAACFVWLPGQVWLATGILGKISHGYNWTQVRIDLFPLKASECGATECLDVLFGTWPALNSITYSIGAAIALSCRPRRFDSEEQSREYTSLGLE